MLRSTIRLLRASRSRDRSELRVRSHWSHSLTTAGCSPPVDRIATGRSPRPEIYDPTSGTFSATGPMPNIRDTCHCGVWALVLVHPRATTLADGRVLIAGGRTTGADIFDPASGTFRRSAPIPCDASRSPITTLADGRVLVICPATPSRGGQAALYDPATDTFSSTGAPRTSSAGAATLLLDGRVLLTGEGFLGTLLPAAAELYDPTSGTFTIVDDPLNPNADSSVVPLPDGRVLFLYAGQRAPVGRLRPRHRPLHGRALSLDRRRVAVGIADGRVLVLPATSDQDLGPSFCRPSRPAVRVGRPSDARLVQIDAICFLRAVCGGGGVADPSSAAPVQARPRPMRRPRRRSTAVASPDGTLARIPGIYLP